ncbi:MAG: glycosyltransferase family 4 protein [Thermoguttaceae bacterium]
MKRKNLIIVGNGGGGGFRDETGLYTHFAHGMLVNLLAEYYEKVTWCAPKEETKSDNLALRLADNVVLVAHPRARSTLNSFKYLGEYKKAWKEALAEPGDVFLRGMFPAVGAFYKTCQQGDFRPLHWLVGNPIALIKSHRRNGFIMDNLALLYAKRWENTIKRGVERTDGAFLCFGEELFDRVDGYTRYNIIGAPVLEEDIYFREDTCQNDTIRILFVGFVRPEKGVQYLIEALSLLRTQRKVELVCIGTRSDKFAAYNKLLDETIKKNGLEDRVSFPGYLGREEIYENMRNADLFVLPTLSEGAGFVLIESLSQGLPVIASAVGGLPTTIDDGKDGLLVPPKAPAAIADAIDCVIEDEELRRGLIANGYDKVRETTYDKFASKIVGILDQMNGRDSD